MNRNRVAGIGWPSWVAGHPCPPSPSFSLSLVPPCLYLHFVAWCHAQLVDIKAQPFDCSMQFWSNWKWLSNRYSHSLPVGACSSSKPIGGHSTGNLSLGNSFHSCQPCVGTFILHWPAVLSLCPHGLHKELHICLLIILCKSSRRPFYPLDFFEFEQHSYHTAWACRPQSGPSSPPLSGLFRCFTHHLLLDVVS